MPSDTENTSDNESKEGTPQTEKSTSTSREVVPKRRTKTGCLTCRKRRIKCGEERPVCKNCIKSKRECTGYSHPLVYKPHGSQPPPSVTTSTPANTYAWAHSHLGSTCEPSSYSETEFQSLQTLQSKSADSELSGVTPWHPPHGLAPHPFGVFQMQGPESRAQEPQSIQWTRPYTTMPFTARSGPEQTHSYATNVATTVNHQGIYPSQVIPTSQPANLDHISVPNLPALSRLTTVGFVQRPSFASSVRTTTDGFRSSNDEAVFGEDDDDPNDPWDVILDEHDTSFTDQEPVKDDVLGRPELNLDAETAVSTKIVVPRLRMSNNSPLFDEKSQKIFAHFISVTGPTMGTFDRQEILGNAGPPKMIWTHGLPTIAFHRPALAHAILAVSAIHMFNLNLVSENVAMKHFTCALRRIGPVLSDPKQRLEVSTMATVLLLGYYEVIAGDHSRWSLHLSGAGKLVMEHDYAGVMRTMRQLRTRRLSNIAQPWVYDQTISDQNSPSVASRLLEDTAWEVDQNIVSKLMGFEVDYNTQKQPNFQSEPIVPDSNSKKFDDWKVLLELYWWYCKQDIFMSMLSGDPLLLSYHQWKYCPPRGMIGDANQAHATLDHLWLLLARLSNFGGKDLKRKQRVVNAQGGHWIPAPGFLDSVGPTRPHAFAPSDVHQGPQLGDLHRSAPPSANEGRARTVKQPPMGPPSQPSFYGMMPPPTGPIQMPSSFDVMNAEIRANHGASPTDAESPQAQDLEAQMKKALEEHNSIAEAFDLFESLLGADFQPTISGDIQITTPFGPALQYKSPVIATMWTYFYVGRILLRRMHPYSPPAAMVSAGVNARFTHEHAQLLGRICGGLFARHSYLLQAGYIDTSLSAAVMETTFSLLFGAVQYQDPVQRGWTIGKLSEIAQVTGFQTAAAVAAACESTWEKAGLAGRGPPYERTMLRNNADMRLNGKFRQSSQPNSPPLNMSPTEEHESRFVHHDRNLINKHVSTRAHWALGLLSVDEDLKRITLNDND